jgi:hypothetical protein
MIIRYDNHPISPSPAKLSEGRFVCVLEPTDIWVVWDEALDAPAESSEGLYGIGAPEARNACRRLNQKPQMEGAWNNRGRVAANDHPQSTNGNHGGKGTAGSFTAW